MKDIYDVIGIVMLFLGGCLLVAAVMFLPAWLLSLAWNYIGPQFGSTFVLHVWTAWVGLFALGLIGRALGLKGGSK